MRILLFICGARQCAGDSGVLQEGGEAGMQYIHSKCATNGRIWWLHGFTVSERKRVWWQQCGQNLCVENEKKEKKMMKKSDN